MQSGASRPSSGASTIGHAPLAVTSQMTIALYAKPKLSYRGIQAAGARLVVQLGPAVFPTEEEGMMMSLRGSRAPHHYRPPTRP